MRSLGRHEEPKNLVNVTVRHVGGLRPIYRSCWRGPKFHCKYVAALAWVNSDKISGTCSIDAKNGNPLYELVSFCDFFIFSNKDPHIECLSNVCCDLNGLQAWDHVLQTGAKF